MIPEFPIFKYLELEDRAQIVRLTTTFLPYSDFNFTSIWSWNVDGKIEVSLLNSNLIVKFSDYITGEPFFSFLGKEKVGETIDALVDLVKKEKFSPLIKLLPEEVVPYIPNKYTYLEDIDNFDYIFSTEKLATYKGNKLGPKRNFVNRFLKKYSTETRVISNITKDLEKQFFELFNTWKVNKNFSDQEVENELQAVRRFISFSNSFNFFAVCIFSEGKLVGFTINELVQNNYAILHFEKADSVNFIGIYAFLMQETAKFLLKEHYSFLNYEQDLGIPGLRKCKNSFAPEKYLKKYRIELNP